MKKRILMAVLSASMYAGGNADKCSICTGISCSKSGSYDRTMVWKL